VGEKRGREKEKILHSVPRIVALISTCAGAIA